MKNLSNINEVQDIVTKEYVDDGLSSKSDSSHSHTDLHTHVNKTVIDGLTDNEGTLQYNGKDIGVGGVFTIKREEFTAIENQTVFSLTKGSYTTGFNRLSVYIWGSKQYNNAFVETSSTSFTMSDGLSAGDKVIAEWIEAVNISGLYEGHASTHATGGMDELTPSMIGADMTVISTTQPTNGATMWYEEVV